MPPTNPDAKDLRLKISSFLSPSNPKSNSPISSTASPTNNQSDWKKFLFFKILALEQPSIQELTKIMPKIWKLKATFKISEYHENSFAAKLESIDDAEYILANGPWKFNDDLILLERSMANKTPDQYTFDKAELWIQFHGLPVNLLNADFVTLLASNLGTVSPISQRDVDAWSLFARAKVTFDATVPLVREVEGPVGVISKLKYEGLPKFCRFCGRMGHSVQSCPTREDYIAMIRDDWTDAEKKVIWDLLEARLDDSIVVKASQKIPVRDSHEDAIQLIRNMFRYDPNRFVGADDDDSDMEPDFSQIQKEEQRRRYNPNTFVGAEDDDSDMEADYSQIQKEERRSSKIAKDEDEKELRLIDEEDRQERKRKKQKLSRR